MSQVQRRRTVRLSGDSEEFSESSYDDVDFVKGSEGSLGIASNKSFVGMPITTASYPVMCPSSSCPICGSTKLLVLSGCFAELKLVALEIDLNANREGQRKSEYENAEPHEENGTDEEDQGTPGEDDDLSDSVIIEYEREDGDGQEHIKSVTDNEVCSLVNLGTCWLHVVHGSLRTRVEPVNWDIGSVLRHTYYLFTDSTARRALFTQFVRVYSFSSEVL
uniref:Uncharacterized protein n=1 Tax=Timema tahoe TaxID=61484 RepID=A0A7R9IM71_9NEOP|nr:unnamed protein product [Timema tahoe]